MEERPRFSGRFLCAPEFISLSLINSYTFKKTSLPLLLRNVDWSFLSVENKKSFPGNLSKNVSRSRSSFPFGT